MALLPAASPSKFVRPRDFAYELRVQSAQASAWGSSLVGAGVAGLVGLLLWCVLLTLPFRWAYSSSVIFDLAGALVVASVIVGAVRGARRAG